MTGTRKLCAAPACPNAHRNRGMYCDEHIKPKDDSYRPSAAQRGYDRDWQRESKKYLREHPWCECLECRGRPLPSEVVDHIKPHKGDMVLFWKRSNWQAMSKMCHDRKTVEKDGGLGR